MIKNKSFRLKSTIFPIDNFAPIRENKSAWLSLDGIFSAHAKTPTIITVKRQAHETALPYFAFVISPSAPTLLPTEKFDVFISHAHKDWDLASRFKNYLEQTFSLRVFVDSAYWGNIDNLQKELNSEHLKNGKYDYKLTNRVAQHANIILATALSDMINKCELVFFLHTENSVAEVPDLLDKEATFSPWIYYELHTAVLLEKNKQVALDEAFYSATESLKQISYKLPLSEMTKLERKDFDEWESWYDFYGKDGYESNALKSLYEYIDRWMDEISGK